MPSSRTGQSERTIAELAETVNTAHKCRAREQGQLVGIGLVKKDNANEAELAKQEGPPRRRTRE